MLVKIELIDSHLNLPDLPSAKMNRKSTEVDGRAPLELIALPRLANSTADGSPAIKSEDHSGAVFKEINPHAPRGLPASDTRLGPGPKPARQPAQSPASAAQNVPKVAPKAIAKRRSYPFIKLAKQRNIFLQEKTLLHKLAKL